MKKTVRIALYILSILTIVGVIAAFVVSGRKNAGQETLAEKPTGIGQETLAENPAGVGQEAPSDAGEEMQAGTSTEAEQKDNGQTEEPGASAENEDTAEADSQEAEDAPDAEGDTTILFTGDVLFANAFKAGYDAKGIDGVLSPEVLKELNAADILMINNEFPFSSQGEPMEDKQFTFRSDPSYVKALNEMGVDVVSLANNHALDYGKEALRDTFKTLDKAGILYGGAGESVERAEELQIIEVNGKKFGFLAVSRVIPVADWKVEKSTPGIFSCYDETRLVELVAEAKKQCDFVAVYPHWGVEYQAHPEDYQKKIAEKCIKAGADFIVGSHTHCLQGVEFIDGKPVFYSLGNFIFGRDIDRSVIVKVTVTAAGEASYELLPVYAAGGITQYPDETAAQGILNYIGSISSGAKISPDGTVTP